MIVEPNTHRGHIIGYFAVYKGIVAIGRTHLEAMTNLFEKLTKAAQGL